MMMMMMVDIIIQTPNPISLDYMRQCNSTTFPSTHHCEATSLFYTVGRNVAVPVRHSFTVSTLACRVHAPEQGGTGRKRKIQCLEPKWHHNDRCHWLRQETTSSFQCIVTTTLCVITRQCNSTTFPSTHHCEATSLFYTVGRNVAVPVRHSFTVSTLACRVHAL